MSVAARPDEVGAGVPEPLFAVDGAAHRRFAAAPTMVFSATATDATGHAIQSIALSVSVMIDPARRGYEAPARERLAELFGPPSSWAAPTHGLPWAQVSALVPEFSAATAFEIAVPCTYDLEITSAKYFHGLADPPLEGDGGTVPLSFHFNGTVFYREPRGRLQVVPVPWSRTAQYGMPLAAWQAMIAEHYPGGGWVRLRHETLARLNERRARRGDPGFDDTVGELLDGVRRR